MDLNYDTLILLVGTNPLPNFVVSEYFLKNNINLENIVLIYSEKTRTQAGTGDFAKRIEELIKKRFIGRKINFIKIPLSDVSLPNRIYNDLRNSLSKRIMPNSKIHLNYTGGTKSMAVQCYKFLNENFKEKCTYSYLDARSFQIVYDKDEKRSEDLRKIVNVTLEEILELHGYDIINKQKCKDDSEYENPFRNAVEFLGELIERDRLKEYFEAYDRGKFIDEKGHFIIKPQKLKEIFKNYNPHPLLIDIIQRLPEKYKIFDQNGNFQEKSKSEIKSTIKFLDGQWLELYVFETLKEKFNVCLDLEIRKQIWHSDLKFQLDLIIIKGYQLIGISCTTSSEKALCKSKGFEVFLRITQIGGQEARAVLITTMDEEKRSQVEEELQIDTGGRENIIVLGIADLKPQEMIKKIENFIE